MCFWGQSVLFVVEISVCLTVMICSQDRCSSVTALREAFVALIGWRASPNLVLRILKVSSAAVGVALLVSLHPSMVKYYSLTYSRFLIFPMAY